MHKYVVAIHSNHDGDNRLFLIEADDEAEAAKQALIAHCPKKYRDENYIDWVTGLGDDFESVFNGAAQGELTLSTPLRIDSLTTLSKARKSNP